VSKTARNILIVAAVALLIVALPGGGGAARLVLGAISLAFFAAIAFLVRRLYAENRLTLWSLTTAHRALLYGAIAAAFATLVATPRLWETGLGTVVWFGLLLAAGVTVSYVWRESRRYSI
jgi:hypothetical protein